MSDRTPAGGVVITGASTGIGEATAVRLARSGFRVFAGVRRDEDAERLGAAHASITPVRLEVTDAEEVAACVETVSDALAGRPLMGVVNNAGIAVASPLEFVPLDELRRQFEVNTIAPIAVTQAFMPMLRASRGRVVQVSSISGRSALPFAGAYSASKFALEALSDAMRIELQPWGIRVVVIEPGSIATPIWRRGEALADKMLAKMPARVMELYGRRIERAREAAMTAGRTGGPPETVARVIEKALTVPNPRARYLVGRDARIHALFAAAMPTRLRDRIVERALRG